jgi:transcriptional regulator of acetoin/glycerol metabolism
MNKTVGIVPDKTVDWLVGYEWPGNVRELQNVIERAVILYSRGEWRFTVGDLRPATQQREDRQQTLVEAERRHIVNALRHSRGVISGRNGAAVRLGLPRTTLMAKMKRLGISLSDSELRFDASGSIDAPIRYRFPGSVET